MKLKSTLLVAWALIASATVPAQTETPEQKAERMEWFSRAKLGIFIHWGIYSTGRTSESWAFHNKTVPFEEYMDQAKEFTAANYDPAYWAKLIKESGAQYTVITTKHHDGFALWDTKAGDFSAVKSAPAKKDVLAPFCEEIRKQGLKLGFYYSLIDWPREDYPNIFREGPAKYDIHKEPERWQHFVDFNFAQLRELNETWKPDLYWFDGDWEQKAEDWRAKEIVEMLRETTPGVIVNSRIQGYGDYDTPELGVPVTRPASKWWETCMTINGAAANVGGLHQPGRQPAAGHWSESGRHHPRRAGCHPERIRTLDFQAQGSHLQHQAGYPGRTCADLHRPEHGRQDPLSVCALHPDRKHRDQGPEEPNQGHPRGGQWHQAEVGALQRHLLEPGARCLLCGRSERGAR